MANTDIKETSTPASATSQSSNNPIATASSVIGLGASAASLLGFSADTKFKAPMGNPLHKYASYTQVFTLAILTPDLIANPEKYILKKTIFNSHKATINRQNSH